jgi:uncharacterized protein YecE (DUF72 family)
MFFVGTSGWHYRDWSERFYPQELEPSGWLRYHSRRFVTVELNNSFYRLPERSTFAHWRNEVPSDFVMAVKASRYLTHTRRLIEPEEPVARLWSAAQGLGTNLGPVLFQLPPSLQLEFDRLRSLLEVLPTAMQAAFEFRHASWFIPEVFELLDSVGAALVWPDTPGRRFSLPLTGGWAYIRFHRGSRVSAGYRRSKLTTWAKRLADMPASDAFIYFNNDQGGAAVRDAQVLCHLLERRGASVARADETRHQESSAGIGGSTGLK